MPLTTMQEGMLFHYIMKPKALEYYGQTSLGLIGDIDVDLLQKAWNIVIQKNEMLRTVYRWKGINNPVQMVLKNHQVVMQNYDLSNEERAVKEKRLHEIKQADFKRRIDIEKETLRITLCKWTKDEYTMIISNHHILYDGWSSGIMIKELINVYHDLYRELEPRISFKNKFSEYVKWIRSQDKIKQKNYWGNYLSGALQNDDLFRRVVLSEMKSYECALGKNISDQITEFAKENGVSVASLLYSAWGILIQKLNNTHDILFGITTSGRNQPIKGIESMIGLFINTIPLRIQTDEQETIFQLLKKVNQTLKDSQEFESTSLVDINEYAGLSHQSQLFNSLVVVENYPLKTSDYQDGLVKISHYSATERTNYNLTLGITIQDFVVLNFQYNCFADDEMIKKLGQYLQTILTFILRDKNSKIIDIDLLPKAEQEKILYEFNATSASYPKEKTIHQLFEEQVEKTPRNTALFFEEVTLTYHELNERSNQLARLLREKDVKPDQIVGLMVGRTPEMVIGILGILKAGAAYLPIDPDYPEERIRFMLENSHTKVLLTQPQLHSEIPFAGERINLDAKLYEGIIENLENVNHPQDLAYVIYTSGSTGVPKGVMVEHRNVVNLAMGQKDKYKINEYDRVAQFYSISFDPFIEQLLITLLSGATLYLADKATLLDSLKFNLFLRNNAITHLDAVPSFLNELNFEGLDSLKRIVSGGEACPLNLAKRLSHNFEFYNGYGPTEATVTTTMYRVNPEKIDRTVLIGKPIANYQIYILNRENKLSPIGIEGELCIAGHGLARGYLNHPELTATKFVQNPFGENQRMYRTGDLARWLPSGNIEFLGRIDHQVKIRGFRIELEEVEKQILQYAAVKEAVVLAQEGRYLCAYFASETEISANELRQHLSKSLPDYMVPSYFVQLKKIPLTPNGKIDKKALPEPEVAVETQYVAPRNKVEEKLVQIWGEVLSKEKVGVHDNFFELGGHSLKATVVASRIHKELNVELPLKELFKAPTIAGASEYLLGAKESVYAAIKPVELKAYYGASSAQKRIWLIQQFDHESTGYNMPGVLVLDGNLDRQRLEGAFSALIQRHESLRTTFGTIDSTIVQRVSENVEFKVEYSESQSENIEAAIKAFVRPFNLSQAPLLRVGLIRATAPSDRENAGVRHYLLFDMHHIIADGTSVTILKRELMALYGAEELITQKISYKDFSQWQNDYLQSEKIKEQEHYWLEQFSGEIPLLNLTLDYPRPTVQNFEGASVKFKLDYELTTALNSLARINGATLYMVLLSAVNILLFKYTEQEEIIVGSPIAGRPHSDLEGIIGMFVNTLAMRNYPMAGKTYAEFLQEIKATALQAYEHQDYQFEELVERLHLKRDMSRNPLFDVLLVLQNMEEKELEIEGLTFKDYEMEQVAAKFDLTFIVWEAGEELFFSVDYGINLFKRATIERLATHLQNVLSVIVKNVNTTLGEIDMLSEQEQRQLRLDFNDTFTEYPRHKTIHQLFEERVAKTPDDVALIFGEELMTCRELNAKVNQVAWLLKEKGVKRDQIVGIMVERSFEMVIGILGILKAGGAYLPVDPEYPQERINFILEDSQTTILLTQSWLRGRTAFANEIINLDKANLSEGITVGATLEMINSPHDVAYVLYTSGSTGMPKGVTMEHRAAVNMLFEMERRCPVLKEDAYLLKTTYTFDVSTSELFGWFIGSGKAVILSTGAEKSPEEICKAMVEYNVTHINFVPSMLNVFLDVLKLNQIHNVGKLKYLIAAGEALGVNTVKKFFSAFEETKLENVYGPTETTYTTIYAVDRNKSYNIIPIGKPMANYQIYILNTSNQLTPIGVPGEVYIGGEGLARGYLNLPELTATKFIENPLIPGEQVYRTGDLARWLADGSIEYLGRMDQQAKIRGFRIELGEIESYLLEIEKIKEAVVVARVDGDGDNYLCAYLVLEEELSISQIRNELSTYLPDHMIPSYFVKLEAMPLTANGKIDKKALPEPEATAETEYVPPRNAIEKILAQIWSEVLGRERVGIDDSFFDLGGHSLKATIVASRIHKELSVELPLKELFKAPTIAGVSEYLLGAKESVYAAIKPVGSKEYYEASSAGKRLWIIQQLDHEGTGYNMPGVLILDGDLDKQRLEEAFSALIQRHESLRTTFSTVDDVIVQRVSESVEFKIEYSESPSAEIEAVIKTFIRPFDLSKAPLLRVGLIREGISDEQSASGSSKMRHYLLFDMHHIISDGTSMTILKRELMTLYGGGELMAQRIGYKDFAQWQNEYLQSEKIKVQEHYWLEQFSGEIPLLNLALDYPRPKMQSFEGASVKFKLNRELTAALNNLARANDATLYMVLLAAVNILLFKYTAAEDIIIGSPIAGRPHSDLEDILGMFVNTLAMRNYPRVDKTYAQFLHEVKNTALQAYEHQDYQFEELVERLNLRRDTSRNPLFDVMFVLQNMEEKELEIKGLTFKDYEMEQVAAKFDLTFSTWEVGEELLFTIDYGVKLFKSETVERLATHLQNVLSVVTKNMNIKLGEIEMLSEREYRQLRFDFNDTFTDYPRKTIHELLEEQALKSPDRVALMFGAKRMTCGELNARANQVARLLREKGVGRDHIVAIIVERSFEMVIGVLGILKAGGAYLPIDPEYPLERIKFILEDSESEILLTQSWLIDRTTFEGEKINLDEAWVFEREGTNLAIINSPSDLAYVLYTSGSTGMPKGVLMEHRAVVNMLFEMEKRCPLLKEDVYLLKTTYTFDVSTAEMFGWFVGGGKVAILPAGAEKSPEQIWEAIIQYGVTHINFVPSMLKVFIDILKMNQINHLGNLKYVITAGEALSVNLVNKFFATFKGIKLENAYGPTETTYTTTYAVDPLKNYYMIPIGKPMANYQIYLLNASHKLVPIGVPGELYIGGEGLGRGYLNHPERTGALFIENPLAAGERVYRTGDLARWLPDGNIEYLGRIDHQVKIRGIRIELSEIESRLLELKKIKEVVVVAREDANDDKYLCAYFVSEGEILASELRASLSEMLPDHMIPSYFVPLARIPFTPNGKIDRLALPEPDRKGSEKYIAPRTIIEEKIARIWCEVLDRERVGIYDNFFELGGHSLKATVVISKIHKELNVALPLKELFSKPSISGISEYLSKAKESVYATIKPAIKKQYYEASSAEKRMWLLWQFDHESTAYNMPGVLILDGDLDKGRLEDVFLKLIKRHETLRTTFDIVNDGKAISGETTLGYIIQRVAEEVDFAIEYAEGIEENIEALIEAFIRPFNLSQAPLLRVKLIKTCTDRHYLFFDMHHIISDGVSLSIVTKEFMALYEGRELEAPRIQYKDFSEWQNEYFKSEAMREQERYWLEQFAEEVPILNLPLDYRRPSVQNFAGGSFEFKLSHELTEKLNILIEETGATLYMVLLSVINILLSKYTHQEDITVGSPIAGRPHADLENIIGMFVNTLAMRNYPKSEKTYVEFLKEVKETALAAYENQDYPFEELVEKLNLHRDLSRNPLFDVMFALQNMETKELAIEGLALTKYEAHQVTAKFDLTFVAIETKGEILFNIEYRTSLFKRETIKRLSIHLLNLIEAIITNKDVLLSDIDLLSEDECRKVLYEFNDTDADYPSAKTIHQLFAEQVEKTPEHPALVFQNESLTYRELNKKSSQVARLLREKGAKPGHIVGLMVERSFEMIIGILGILKSGAAYLPIAPEYPEERIRFMLEDSKTKILLTQSWISEKVLFDGEQINFDEVSFKEARNLEIGGSPNDLAYVIYTSGSTGTPKGVMVEHKSVVNLLYDMERKYPLKEDGAYLLKTPYIFDVSVPELFGGFISGARLVILEPEHEKLPKEIINAIYQSQVTHINFVPTMLNAFLTEATSNEEVIEKLQTLKYVFVAGEPLKQGTVSTFYQLFQGVKLENLYGPTEATVYGTRYTTAFDEENQFVPIGKPLSNTKMYILKKQQLCGLGIPGELCIGGHGLARGYLNRSELTAEKFVANPFMPDERLYRTGDLARWLPDGNIEFLGRMDDQVKLRGFRIELGEIENQIQKLDAVKETVVLVQDHEEGEKFLSAYIVSEKEILASEIRQHLATTLPGYMIPSYFMRLERMPLTSSGKIDRKAMPAIAGKAEARYVAPRTAAEEILAIIWSEVLGKEKVGIYDNFFELGGHSLKATVVISRIHKELNAELSLKELFQTPTIAGISEYLSTAIESTYRGIKPVIKKEYYDTSSAQKRMWLLQQFDHQSTVYNIPIVLILDGILDKRRLEQALLALIERHESLRTTFDKVNDVIVQRIVEKVKFEVEYAESRSEHIEETIKSFIRPFELQKAPLLRAVLIKVDLPLGESKRHYLLVDMHHIIADGVSMSILIEEFMTFYEGHELAAPRIGYKDFSEWQNEYLKSAKMKQQENYWLAQFSEEIPLLDLHLDYPRPMVQSFEGASVEFTIDRELTKALNNLARENDATLYMVLLAAINILLAKYSALEDIIIGTPIAGRSHADLEGIIGMFVNTLAMRNYPKSETTYGEFLKTVKEVALRAYENQDYQFEELIEKLNLRRDLSRNPLFDVMFVLQNTEIKELVLEGLKITEYNLESTMTKFDLTFSAFENKDEILFSIEYNTSLFKRETIKRLSVHLQNLIKIITVDKHILLRNIDILSKEERDKILYEFNNTDADYPRDKTIQQLFEEQVKRVPDKIALVFEKESLTYRELNEQSNQLAKLLKELGVKPNCIVGIMVERTPAMLIGILGILKSGGAYLPIDPNYPEERTRFMLEDAGVELLLTQPWLNEKMAFNGEVIILDEAMFDKGGEEVTETQLATVSSPNDLAYVIYTSGSTGKPKGVMVEHKSVVNLLYGMKKNYPLQADDAYLLKTAYTFDVSIPELFSGLIAGERLVILKEGYEKLPKEIINTIDHGQVTHISFVPSMLIVFLEECHARGESLEEKLKTLKYVLVAGEALRQETVTTFYTLFKNIKLENLHGPTEATVYDTSYATTINEKNHTVPIGKPLANYKAYILSATNNIVPLGVPGELCIAGDGLARGYLNRPELTTEKFIKNPIIPGEDLYRTGDLGRWLPDGNIEFLGRIDHQVKIRGFRIELGEIESQILKFSGVKDVTVLAREEQTKDAYLCAYFVAEKEILASEFRQHLSTTLPGYMIPTYFMQLEKMPLLTSGKIDKKALPEPDGNGSATYVSPRNETEKALVQIWCEVLGKERIGVDDNFFELGGHSLKATVVISRIHKKFNVELPLNELFKKPTISEISEYLSVARKSIYKSIELIAKQDYYETSAAQKRMYVMWAIDKESTAYNMPSAIMLAGRVDVEKLERTIQALVNHHEILRTTFLSVADELMQKVHDQLPVGISYHKLGKLSLREKIHELIQPFNLTKAPLLRMACIEINESKHLLVFDIHHIIFDGLSMGIFLRDFITLYAGKDLKKPRIGYKDYAAWHNQHLTLERMELLADFWRKQLEAFSETNLPERYVNTDSHQITSRVLKSSICGKHFQDLDQFSLATGMTKFTLMLGIFQLILMRILDQDRITIGIPVAGRQDDELADMIGMFLNTLVLATQIDRKKTFRTYIFDIKDQINAMLDHQEYPYENLHDDVRKLAEDQGKSLFSIMFNYMPYQEEEEEIILDHVTAKRYNFDEFTPKYGLSLYIGEREDKITIDAVYRSSIEENVIEHILNGFPSILDAVINNPERLLRDIELNIQSETIDDDDFNEEFEDNDF